MYDNLTGTDCPPTLTHGGRGLTQAIPSLIDTYGHAVAGTHGGCSTGSHVGDHAGGHVRRVKGIFG